jgi:hypothetical protein
MFDLNKIDDGVSPLISALQNVKDEIEARKILMDNLSYISKLTGANWEREKLGIIGCSIPELSESKLEKIRKVSKQSEIIEDEDIEQAKQKLSRAFCALNGKNYAYMVMDGKNLRPFPPQELTPLVRLVAGEDKLEESRIYESIHCKRQIEKITTHVSPSGQTHYAMIQLENGKFEAVCKVSLDEMLKNQLKNVSRYEVTPAFKNMVDSYRYIFDIYEYALALKFAFDKTNCIWIREHSDTGKTFFLGAREAKEYILIASEKINENDFVGDGPEKWGKMLFWFIDEAVKFGADMKNACLPYRMNYGGRVELDIPLRILSSDNEITDLTNGVDKQIDNRVINMHYLGGKNNLRKWLDDNKVDATTAQMMWQKMILSHLIEIIKTWSKAENLQVEASKIIVAFKKKYKKAAMDSIGDMAIGMVEGIIAECENEGFLTREITKGFRDFKDFLLKDGEKIYLRSPKTFFAMAFKEYAPEKERAFFKKYPNNEAIALLYSSSYSIIRIKDQRFKGVLIHG